MTDGKKSVFLTVLKIVDYILIAIMTLIVCLNLYLFGSDFVYGNEMPTIFGYTFASMNSNDMAPALRKGDLLLLKKQDFYNTKDKVLFFVPGAFEVKTVVGYTTDSYRLSGKKDKKKVKILRDKVFGKIAWHADGWGNVMKWLSSVAGLIVLVIADLILVAIPIIIRNITRKSKAGYI